MSIYFIIYLVVTIPLLIVNNNLVYVNHAKSSYKYDQNDDYIAATIYSIVWPVAILAIFIVFGSNFIWKYILFPLFTAPARLYLKYKKK